MTVGRLRTRTACAVLLTGCVVASGCVGTSTTSIEAVELPDERPDSMADTQAVATVETTTSTTTTAPPRPPADTLTLQKLRTISGDIAPKSVVASGTGFVTAQNMMYRHTVTAYDADGELIATIPDTVRLSDFGIDTPGEHRGAPVEAAFTPDGEAVYVSNYSMYGPGFRAGSDTCSPGDGTSPSFLYRIVTASWEIDQIIPTGAVPKYVAVTPDGTKVLTTNWCTYDMTIADTQSGEVLSTIDIGRYPRGIAVTSDSATAFVAIMGSSDIARVDLATGVRSLISGVGRGPRHIVLSPDDRHLYATLNAAGEVIKVDVGSGTVAARVSTGNQPRSMDISSDGSALYVVNYMDNSMTKVATGDMSLLETVGTGHRPIGITYDDLTGRVWVANYGGTIDIWDEVS